MRVSLTLLIRRWRHASYLGRVRHYGDVQARSNRDIVLHTITGNGVVKQLTVTQAVGGLGNIMPPCYSGQRGWELVLTDAILGLGSTALPCSTLWVSWLSIMAYHGPPVTSGRALPIRSG